MRRFITISLLILLFSGCASYYKRNQEFQSKVAQGDLEKAEKILLDNKTIQRERNRLLFLLNMGYLKHMQQDFSESNQFFNQADILIEDYGRNYGAEALALISNPEVKPYKAEDFEVVMIHYYKAINFLKLRDFEGALVEARRMNLVLNRLNDKYKNHKNRYQADAFAHIIMGLAYEASGNINDAFIAYRNAYQVYTNEHGYFEISVPKQLQLDILRTTYVLGFQNDHLWYKEKFGMEYKHVSQDHGEAVVIWQNGMGPVKDEWNINFFAVPGEAGYIIFKNEEFGLTFPFYIGDDKDKKNDLLALKVVRVAFPKYLERPNYFTEAWVESSEDKLPLQVVQDINAIAFKTLQDRFLREMGTSLLRLALKKAAEYELSKQNEALGAIATITNAVTERADTRNWQTLPHTIAYARVPLKKGINTLKLKAKAKDGTIAETSFETYGKMGQMEFIPYHHLEHLPAASWDRAATVRVK
ncbi:MAG: hypothetical protein WEC59_10575 [Salibacteraceae bacterium]